MTRCSSCCPPLTVISWPTGMACTQSLKGWAQWTTTYNSWVSEKTPKYTQVLTCWRNRLWLSLLCRLLVMSHQTPQGAPWSRRPDPFTVARPDQLGGPILVGVLARVRTDTLGPTCNPDQAMSGGPTAALTNARGMLLGYWGGRQQNAMGQDHWGICQPLV